jgi:hypothetical protein
MVRPLITYCHYITLGAGAACDRSDDTTRLWSHEYIELTKVRLDARVTRASSSCPHFCHRRLWHPGYHYIGIEYNTIFSIFLAMLRVPMAITVFLYFALDL